MVTMTRYLCDLVFKMLIQQFICAVHVTPFKRKGETKQKEDRSDAARSMCNGVFKPGCQLPGCLVHPSAQLA